MLLAFNQLVTHASKFHFMDNGQTNVPMVVWAAIGRGWGSGAQHSQAIHGMLLGVPGLKIVMPSTPYDAKGLLLSAILDNNPVCVFEHRWLMKKDGVVPEGAYRVPIGKGIYRRRGRDLTIVGASHAIELGIAGRHAARGGRHRRRGHRSAHRQADRRGDRARIVEEDRPHHRRRHGLDEGRAVRRDRLPRRRERVRRSEGAGRAHRIARRPHARRLHPRAVLLSRRRAHRRCRAPPGSLLMAYELSSTSWGQEELDAMQRVLRSGRFTMGEQVRLFEDAFAARFGMKHAVMVNSGSSANLVGVAALFYRSKRPLQRGDEVIVPAISWATTFHPLQQYGLKLRFVDVELDTLNMDASKLEAALTPTHAHGRGGQHSRQSRAALDRIRAFCDAHDLILFEDNCESMGASLNGQLVRHVRRHQHVQHLLLPSHLDDGGRAAGDQRHGDRSSGARDPQSRLGARRAGRFGHQSGAAADDPFFEAYRFVVPGYNVRPLEMAGAVGLEQLKKLDAMLAVRRQNAAHFVKLFKDDARFIIQRENGASSWFSFTIILNPGMRISTARA